MYGETLSLRTVTPQKRALAAVAASLSLFGAGCSRSSEPKPHSDFSGGCAKFVVYAQNRYDPLGAATREDPSIVSKKIGGFAGNEAVPVDGWIHSEKPTYPTNSAPWNNDAWFHLANEAGWVSFPGVRGEPTSPDPTHGHSLDGGQPAPLDANCQGTYKK